MELYHFSSESNIALFKPRVKHNRRICRRLSGRLIKHTNSLFSFLETAQELYIQDRKV